MWIKNLLLGLLFIIAVVLVAALIYLGVVNSGVGARELTDDDMMVDWMAQLDDETPLYSLYIPGTHNSGALYSFLGVSGKCQSYTIEEQLNMGVRFLDIRLQIRGDELVVVHSFVDQKLSFDDVLDDIESFIKENPSEFLIVSVKQDADPENASVSFEAAVESYLTAKLGAFLSLNSELPSSVGEARGRVHIISRYANSTLGVPASSGWADSTSFELGTLYVQDYYAISDTESKINDICSAFNAAKEGKHSLVLNFTSCYIADAFPPNHAPTAAKLINPLINDILSNGKAAPCVFVSDFVTPELVSSIIKCNFN